VSAARVPHLHRWAPALAETLPYLPLGTPPTPVRPLDGLDDVWVKEEGAYGDGRWGGNKIRKLEWTLPDARRQGRSTILTFGATGTNHGLATARYAIDHGFDAAVAVTDQPEDEHVRANFARLRASGAAVHRTHTTRRTKLAAPWLLLRHRRPYVLPPGGSSPVGALGYVEASFEIAEQVERGELPRPSTIVCAVGTAGTMAGLLLGLRLAGLDDVRVQGVVVNDALPLDPERTTRLAAKAAQVLRRRGATVGDAQLPTVADARMTYDALGPGYGHATEQGTRAQRAALDRWSLQLDPVYTAKAFGHLLDADRPREHGATLRRPVLFLDTNGPRP